MGYEGVMNTGDHLQDANEEANSKTWAGPRLGEKSVNASTSTWHNQKARPSVFDAFDIQRPTNRMAHKTVAKHRSIFDAFGVTDSPRSGAGEPSGGLASMPSAGEHFPLGIFY